MRTFLVCGDDTATRRIARVLKGECVNNVKPRDITIFALETEHKTAHSIRKVIGNKNLYQPISLKKKILSLLNGLEHETEGFIFVTDLDGVEEILNSLRDTYEIDKNCKKVTKGSIMSVQNSDINRIKMI